MEEGHHKAPIIVTPGSSAQATQDQKRVALEEWDDFPLQGPGLSGAASEGIMSMDEDLDMIAMDTFDDYLEELDTWDEKIVEPVMYSSFNPTPVATPAPMPQPERSPPEPKQKLWSMPPSIPTSFDEQLQLAMALSLQTQDEGPPSQQQQNPQQPQPTTQQQRPQLVVKPSSSSFPPRLDEKELRQSMVASFQALKEKQQQFGRFQGQLQQQHQQQQTFRRFGGGSEGLSQPTNLQGRVYQGASSRPYSATTTYASHSIGPPKPSIADLDTIRAQITKKRSLPKKSSNTDGTNSGSLNPTPMDTGRKKPKLGDSTELTYACPICAEENLPEMEMLSHVINNHPDITSRPMRLVCPICAKRPGGNPNYKSRDFYGHLDLRHKPRGNLTTPEARSHAIRPMPYIPAPTASSFVDTNLSDSSGRQSLRKSRRGAAVQVEEQPKKEERKRPATRSQTKKLDEQKKKEDETKKKKTERKVDSITEIINRKDSDLRSYFKALPKKEKKETEKQRQKREQREKERLEREQERERERERKMLEKMKKPSVFIRRRIMHEEDGLPGFNPLVNSNPGVLLNSSRSWRENRNSDEEGTSLLDYLLQMEETQDAVRLGSTGGANRRCDSCNRRVKKNHTRDILACGHTFHSGCLDDFVDIGGTVNPAMPTCPLCTGQQ